MKKKLISLSVLIFSISSTNAATWFETYRNKDRSFYLDRDEITGQVDRRVIKQLINEDVSGGSSVYTYIVNCKDLTIGQEISPIKYSSLYAEGNKISGGDAIISPKNEKYKPGTVQEDIIDVACHNEYSMADIYVILNTKSSQIKTTKKIDGTSTRESERLSYSVAPLIRGFGVESSDTQVKKWFENNKSMIFDSMLGEASKIIRRSIKVSNIQYSGSTNGGVDDDSISCLKRAGSGYGTVELCNNDPRNSGVSLIFGEDAQYLKSISGLELLGKIDATLLIQRYIRRENEKKLALVKLAQIKESKILEINSQPEKFVGILVNLAKLNSGNKINTTNFCSLSSSDLIYNQATLGYIYQDGFPVFAKLPKKKKFETYARSINELYKAVQESSCFGLVLKANEAMQIIGAMKRDGIDFDVLDLKLPLELEDSYAQSRGFSNIKKLKFGESINADSKQVEILDSLGVESNEVFLVAQNRMVKSSYSLEKDIPTLIQFLKDEDEGKLNKITAEAVRAKRIKKLEEDARIANVARLKAEEDRLRIEVAEKSRMAKEYPYYAILTCGMPAHIIISACFAAEKYGVDTELVVSNGASSKMYKAYTIRDAGREQSNGFVIDLKQNFSIKAQNSHGTLILGLTVYDRLSGKPLYQNQAAKFGVVQARN